MLNTVAKYGCCTVTRGNPTPKMAQLNCVVGAMTSDEFGQHLILTVKALKLVY